MEDGRREGLGLATAEMGTDAERLMPLSVMNLRTLQGPGLFALAEELDQIAEIVLRQDLAEALGHR